MEEKEKKYFTRISSTTLENLAKARLTPNEWRTVMALVRKTYGYQKSHDRISISQFQSMTGLERKRQVGALKSLVRKGIVLMRHGHINSYALNRKYSQWVVAGSPPVMTSEEADKLVAFRSQLVAPAGQLPVAGPPHTIHNTIDSIQKNENLQISDLNHTLLADARLEAVAPLVTTAFACAPADIVDQRVPDTEGIRIEQHSGIPEQGRHVEVTASALPASAGTRDKRLRSIKEICREHPDAFKLPDGAGRECAWWSDGSKEGGFAFEECV